ncbi:hypothetical protein SY83_07265 [Paenibacillus swuensis]|uniref:ABC transporter domain-containing protein n=1 Tax=Paenibacillus swuensis TaxID=1178515 RepID=A0A172TGC8_9BACL|nr:ABC transporter ATP-binding protein [Paenibacillus swuensis]ANE46109.1 hypothetical protein SY83_07265 [Paenibacillus swuensis]
MSSKLALCDISLTFAGGGAGPRERRGVQAGVPVLDGVNLRVGDGEFVSVIGPSGSGKSTLFQVIGGVLTPSGGRVLLDGADVTGQTGRISYMPQSNTLLPWRTVLGNLLLIREVEGTADAEARAEAMAWLRRIGLDGYADSYPHVLSGGMQQRVAFLRALLSPKELLCLDEPFGALDALTRQEMQEWLLSVWEEDRRSVLFVTHSIEEALLLSDRIYILSPRPATVIREIQVPFGRPRKEEIRHDAAFIQLRREIYEGLRS